MILINDENRGTFTDTGLMRMRITNHIKMLLKDIDDQKCSPQKRVEAINAMRTYQCRLHDLSEMGKVPFDVLVIVEKKE